MQINIDSFPNLSDPITKSLFSLFRQGDLLFVGGCVRDAVLGKTHDDIDLATPLLPHEVMALANHKRLKAFPTGIEFGTVTFVIDEHPFQITTLRKDTATDGRWAKVEYGTDWKADAARRDFTFNALYMDQTGTIIDYFNGLSDLKEGIVRFIGEPEDRITEDYLRILRFFRFYATYGKISPAQHALEACQKYASKLKTLSKERIHTEILKLLKAQDPSAAIKLMEACHIFQNILPASIIQDDFEQLVRLTPHSLTRLHYLCQNISLGDLTKSLALSRKQQHVLASLKTAIKMLEQNTSLYMLVDTYGKELTQEAIFCTKGNDCELLKQLATIDAKVFPLNGQDLIELGFKEGIELGKILMQCRHWWMENRFKPEKHECIDWVRAHFVPIIKR